MFDEVYYTNIVKLIILSSQEASFETNYKNKAGSDDIDWNIYVF